MCYNKIMEVKIKRFLYLNHDSLFSCYSQVYNGLPTKSTKIKDEQTENYLGIAPDSVDGSLILQTQDYQKSIEMRFHDDLFNKFEKCLESTNLFKENGAEIGDFIRLSGNIEFIDMSYYRSLFENKNFINFLKKDAISKQISANKIQNKQVEKNISAEYDNIKEIIKILCDIIPYSKFAIIGDYLITMEDAYLRDAPSTISYKYGGKMTVLGYTTNLVSNTKKETLSDLSSLSITMNTVLLALLKKSELKIIHALGIYY